MIMNSLHFCPVFFRSVNEVKNIINNNDELILSTTLQIEIEIKTGRIFSIDNLKYLCKLEHVLNTRTELLLDIS